MAEPSSEPSSERPPDRSDVADLYQQEPSSFVPARNALVKELRALGDRDEARAVAALRRPAPAAWGANLLARARPDLIEAVLEAAAEWQDASSAGDRSRTQSSQDDLRAATAAATGAAADLMAGAGRAARPDEVEALRSTLQAAAVDDELAQILRAGLLEVPSAGTGFDGIAAGSVFATTPTSSRSPRSSGRRAGTKQRPATVEDDAVRAAEQAARAAERQRLEAEAERLAEQARSAAAAADRAEEIATEARQAANVARLEADQAEAAAAAARARVTSA